MQGGGGPAGFLLSVFERLEVLRDGASSVMTFRLERAPE